MEIVFIGYVNFPQEQGGNISNTGKSIQVTATVVEAASRLVQCYDGFDRNLMNEWECDSVHLYFKDNAAAEDARPLIMQIASRDPGTLNRIRRRFVSERERLNHLMEHGLRMQRALKQLTGAENSVSSAGQTRNRLKLRMKKLLAGWDRQFKLFSKHGTAQTKCDAWTKLNLLLMNAEDIRQSLINKAKHPRKLGARNSSVSLSLRVPFEPIFTGPSGDNWIGMPLHLFLAEPIVGCCRTMATINTGYAGRLPADERCVEITELHRKLLKDSGLGRFEFPDDDSNPAPYLPALQATLEDYIQRLLDWMDVWDNGGRATVVEDRGLGHPQAPNSSPSSDSIKPDDLAGNAPASCENKLEVGSDLQIKLNGDSIERNAICRTLLGLAYFAPKNLGVIDINTDKYVRLICGRLEDEHWWEVRNVNVSKTWNSEIKRVEKKYPGITHGGEQGEQHVYGLWIMPHAHHDQIKTYFEKHPRRKNSKKKDI